MSETVLQASFDKHGSEGTHYFRFVFGKGLAPILGGVFVTKKMDVPDEIIIRFTKGEDYNAALAAVAHKEVEKDGNSKGSDRSSSKRVGRGAERGKDKEQQIDTGSKNTEE